LIPVLLLLAILWEGTGPGGTRATVELDRSRLSVDRTLQLTVTAASPEGYRLDRAALRASLLKYIGFGPPPFTLQKEEAFPKAGGAERVVYTLDPELPGSHLLTLRRLAFRSGEGQELFLETGVFPVQVELPEADPRFRPEPAPPLPLLATLPVEIAPSLAPEADEAENLAALKARRLPWRAAAALSVAAFAYIAFRILKKRGGKKPTPEEALRQAREEALLALERAGSYSCVADTVRRFFKEGYGIRAPTSTTEELLRSLAARKDFDPETRALIRELFVEADAVKFGRFRPGGSEREEALAAAQKVIKTPD